MTIEYKDSKRISALSTDFLTPIQGFDGGQGHATAYTSGGGGGSSSVGANAVSGQAGNGGTGTQSDITGASPTPYYSAGGGGGLWGTGSTAGSGGSSIGGNGSSANNAGGNASGYGSGGGGAGVQSGAGNGVDQTGGNGSAGIVILRFTTSGNGYSQVGGTVDTSVSGQTIISWTATSGTRTFSPTSAFDVRYLVIGGGGGGGASKAGNAGGGGAGAGGFRTATGHGVTAKTYNITVGALGAGGVAGTGNGSNGGDSSFDGIISIGGGGGSIGFSATNYGQDGASGGGASPYATTNFGQAIQQIIPKPSNVQDNSLLIQKDTAIRYWFSEELAPTFEDDFSSDNWTDAGSNIGVNTSTDVLDFNGVTDGSNSASVYDLGAGNVSDTAWICRFKYTLTSWTNPSGATNYIFIGLSDLPQTTASSASQDFIGFQTSRNLNGSIGRELLDTNGGVVLGASGVGMDNPSIGTQWIEIVRTSATQATIKVFSDSTYSTQVGNTTTATVESGTSGLRYIKVMNRDNASNGGTLIGSIDDVEFYNAVTSITPATWTMKPTLEYDLSTSAGWTTTGSNCSVNTSGQYLEGSSSTNDDRATKALGLTLSDTKFVVRQKMELTTVTSGGNGQLYFGYTDKDNSTTVLGNRDGIGITIRSSPDFLQSYALNQAWQSSVTLSTTPTATTYYLEIIRNSATSYTLNLYSDSNYSVLVETKTNTISSSINGLEYITIGGWDNNASGVITARFSDIQIYNGVTSIN